MQGPTLKDTTEAPLVVEVSTSTKVVSEIVAEFSEVVKEASSGVKVPPSSAKEVSLVGEVPLVEEP